MSSRKWLRARIEARRTVWAAGCYDALSARLIEKAGFEAIITSGFGISASFLGQPDVELYTMTENLAVVRQVVACTSVPVISDCDTGYGNALNVMRTVREFETAGVAAIILEDQITPKRCPAVAKQVEILPIEEGAAKIRAAVEARTDRDLIIIARTDADTEEEAIARARAYVAAGADMVQAISRTMTDVHMLRRFKAAAGAPLSLQVLGWLEEGLSAEELDEIGDLTVFPMVPLMTAAQAILTNLQDLVKSRCARNLPAPRMDMQGFAEMLNFSELLDLQKRFLPGSAPV